MLQFGVLGPLDLPDPEDPKSHRRAIYRFVVRSKQQPFMAALDCADPSLAVEKRNETLTPQQALALLNNKLAVAMAKHFAERVEKLTTDEAGRITAVETSTNLVDWIHWTNIYSPRTDYGYQLPIPPDQSSIFFRLRAAD